MTPDGGQVTGASSQARSDKKNFDYENERHRRRCGR